jgi:hypothetical protein
LCGLQHPRVRHFGEQLHLTCELRPCAHRDELAQRVTRPSIGIGVVMDAVGTGAHARVQVNFESAGPKWLVMAYAHLPSE